MTENAIFTSGMSENVIIFHSHPVPDFSKALVSLIQGIGVRLLFMSGS